MMMKLSLSPLLFFGFIVGCSLASVVSAKKTNTNANSGLLRTSNRVLDSDYSSDGCDESFENVGPYTVAYQKSIVPVSATRESASLIFQQLKSQVGFDALPIDMWFPAAAGCAGSSNAVYNFLTIPPTTPGFPPGFPGYTLDLPLTGVLDCVVAASTTNGFPLIVYSHGAFGTPAETRYLLQRLASYGFFVVAVSHLGNTADDQQLQVVDLPERNYINRPHDVKAVIDFFTILSPYKTSINAMKIGVIGYSLGGSTAYSIAGGYLNIVEEDPRVKAIVTLAGFIGGRLTPDPVYDPILTEENLRSIGVPALVITGTEDLRVPTDINTDIVWDLISTDKDDAYRYDIVGGRHTSFSEVCSLRDFVAFKIQEAAGDPITLGILTPLFVQLDIEAERACDSDALPSEEVQDITTLYTVSFLKNYLADDDSFENFLEEGYTEDCKDNVIYVELDQD